MVKNTLYITFDGLSDPLGQSQILPYLRGIASNGYHITILSCEKTERYQKEKDAILGSIAHLTITWKCINYNEAGGILSRLNYIRKLYRLAKKTLAREQISLVHCRSYLAALIGLRIKRRRKIAFLFDMRGFWADERLDGGIWLNSNPVHRLFYRFFKKQENNFLKESDAVVSLTHAAVEELQRRYPHITLTAKTTVIPCCTDLQLFNPEQTKKTHLPGIADKDHVLIYTGSIGTWYYTREMIDCVLLWRNSIPNLKLLIVTKDRDELDKLLVNYSPEDRSLLVTTSSSYREIPNLLALAKASIFFIKPAYSKIASSPTKMAECWAMNLPIITNAGIGDNDLYFNQHQGGVLLSGFSKEDYRKALESYLQIVNSGDNYRALAQQNFDTQNAIEKYAGIYDSIIRK